MIVELRHPPPGPAPGHSLRELWEARGHTTVEAGGLVWARHRGPVYTPLAPEVQLRPDVAALDALLRSARLPALRAPVACPTGTGGVYRLDLAGYGPGRLQRSSRRNWQRGAERCVIRRLDAAELRRLGLAASRDTLVRHQRQEPELADEARWAAFTRALGRCDGVRMHAAFVGDHLAAWLVSSREGEHVRFLWKASVTALRDAGADPALDVAVLMEAAADGLRHAVNAHVATLGDPGLDRYKRHLGFVVAPHTPTTRVHPLVAPLVSSRLVYGAVRAAQHALPDSTRLALGARLVLEARGGDGDDPLVG